MNATIFPPTDSHAVPALWRPESLNGKVSIAHGFAFKSQHFSATGDYKLMTPGHFFEEGGFRDIGDKQKYYRGPIPEGYVFETGDMVVAMTEQADGLLGSSALVPDDGLYLHNQRLGRVKLLSDSIDLRFLYYVFNSPTYRRGVQETAAGTKVKHTSPLKLLEIVVPLPPLPEQRAIAAALSDVDELIGALDKLIAKKRSIKLATMQQLLTGKTRLPGFLEPWSRSTVGQEFEMQLGKMLDASKNTGVPKPYVGNRAVQWGHVDTSELLTVPLTRSDLMRFRLRKGDLLVCEGGEVGRAAIWEDPISECYYQKAIHRLRPINGYQPRLLMSFLWLWSSTGYLNNYVTQTSIAHLPKDKFELVPLPVPSPKEQLAIVAVLSDMDAEITALKQRRDKTKAVKQGMMQSLLTGRVRLVAPEATA